MPRRAGDHAGKSKAKEVLTDSPSAPTRASKRTRRATLPPTAASLIINEPNTKDPKGKKRANRDSVSEDKSTPSSPKRLSRLEDEEEMMDVDYGVGMHDDEEPMNEEEDHRDGDENAEKSDDEHHDEERVVQPPAEASPDSRRTLEETMAMFDFSRLGPSADPTTKLIALQELSELLSISTEDTLAGSFQVERFIRELVRILGATGGEAAQDEGDDDDDENNDDDAALAAALQMNAGGTLPGDENLEAQLLLRTALQAAANCCRNASVDNLLMIKDVWPIIRHPVGVLKQNDTSDEQLRETLQGLAHLLSSHHTSVSSFELLQSGLADALLEFATSENGEVRQKLLLEVGHTTSRSPG
ncbi:hypothetical protein DFH11DRAFT_1731793 [Phellopilus nigrolimitatus]|nr:hypothetical protein DFH11DRAFT_1731793 [Phellopilus nigrolimitatus]